MWIEVRCAGDVRRLRREGLKGQRFEKKNGSLKWKGFKAGCRTW